jgi:hypothetical protein
VEAAAVLNPLIRKVENFAKNDHRIPQGACWGASVCWIEGGAYLTDTNLLLNPRPSFFEPLKDRLAWSTAWAEAHLKKPTATLVPMDHIIQLDQHCHKLPIREHKTAILVMGAGHNINGLERNGWEHHVSSLGTCPKEKDACCP